MGSADSREDFELPRWGTVDDRVGADLPTWGTVDDRAGADLPTWGSVDPVGADEEQNGSAEREPADEELGQADVEFNRADAERDRADAERDRVDAQREPGDAELYPADAAPVYRSAPFRETTPMARVPLTPAPGEATSEESAPQESEDGPHRAGGRHRAQQPPSSWRDWPGLVISSAMRGRRRAKRPRSLWRELPTLIVIAIALALVIKTYAIQAFFIPSGSMQNTLAIGDRVLINKMVYHLRGISRGDVVVFSGDGSWDISTSPPDSNPAVRFFNALEGIVGITHNSDVYIKRVIGLPGDHVACCDTLGRITVNGVPLSERSYLYPNNSPSAQRFSIIVPPGRLWVMGDHRAVSYDSRGHMGDP